MRSHSGTFFPFVIESYGAFGPQVRRVIKILARHAVRMNGYSSEDEFKRMAFRRLAFICQAGNALVSDLGIEAARRRSL